MAILFNFCISAFSYLFLTAGSGDVLHYWSIEEFIVGIVLGLIIALFTWQFVPKKIAGHIFNPLRWFALVFYMTFPFLLSLVVANIEVIYRVITGRISPAVIKLDTGYKSTIGTFFLANSITLSPGTMTIEMDENDNSLYIHCLNWTKAPDEKFKPADVAPYVYFWLKKIYK